MDRGVATYRALPSLHHQRLLPTFYYLPDTPSLPLSSPSLPLCGVYVLRRWRGFKKKKKNSLSSFFLLLLSHELSLSSSRRFNVDLVAIYFFLFLCLSDVMDVFYRVFSMCLLSLSSLSPQGCLYLEKPAPQTDSNSHVPLLLRTTSTTTPPCLYPSPRPGLS